ncbi:hypothetical protein SDC9_64760 [bioreactor metagenome]|uniref:Uncharacterized protein n=1 Tax=bioreactor metagenome TaxID=1076179 RepID=A0A644XRE9_9ZZZZ
MPHISKKQKPVYKTTVIDKSLNVLYEDSVETEQANTLYFNNALIDNSGNIFFFYNAQRYYIDTARMGTVSFIHTNISTHKSEEFTLNIFEKIENSSPNRTNCLINDYSVAFWDSTTIIVSGVFYNETARVRPSLFFVTINTKDNSFQISVNPFAEEIFGENTASLPALSTHSLIHIAPIILKNDEIISICEEYWENDGGPNSSAVLQYSGNIFATKYDTYGKISWQQKIDKRLKSSSWLNEQAFSYAVWKNKLYIVFIDNINNYSGNGFQESIVNAALKSYDYKVLSIVSMDLQNGEYEKHVLNDFTDINRADFIDKGLQISDDELLIPLFDKGGKNIEFMKIVFF